MLLLLMFLCGDSPGVAGEDFGEGFGFFCDDRVDHLLVFRGGKCDRVTVTERGAQPLLKLQRNDLRKEFDQAVPRGIEEHSMELQIDFIRLARRRAGSQHLPVQTGQFIDSLRRRELHHRRGDRRFEHFPAGVDLRHSAVQQPQLKREIQGDLLRCRQPQNRSAAGPSFQQSPAHAAGDRFPHRPARNTEMRCKFLLPRNPVSRAVFPPDQVVFKTSEQFDAGHNDPLFLREDNIAQGAIKINLLVDKLLANTHKNSRQGSLKKHQLIF